MQRPMTPDERLAVSIPEAARLLAVSRATGYRLVARGAIPSVPLGPRLVRVPLDALRQQLAAAVVPPAPPSIPPSDSPSGVAPHAVLDPAPTPTCGAASD
jgi:excisionase family DNA binding protein